MSITDTLSLVTAEDSPVAFFVPSETPGELDHGWRGVKSIDGGAEIAAWHSHKARAKGLNTSTG
jgi:hypothetical protein